MESDKKQYTCEVRDVFSGDDLVVLVDLGVEDLWKKQRVRLHGVDTPNAVHADEDTEAGRVRKHIRQLARNKRGILTVISQNRGSWVCVVVIESAEGAINLNELLKSQGYVFKRPAA